jgi:murein tripeptide amidase MpaA
MRFVRGPIMRWLVPASLCLAGAGEFSARVERPAEGEVVRFEGEVVVRAMLRTPRDLLRMQQLSDDPWTHAPAAGGTSDWRLPRSRLGALRQAGIAFDILIPDVQVLVAAERERLARPQAKAADWFADFKNLAAINARLDALVAARPDLCAIVTCGSSIQGRSIRGIRISRQPVGTSMPAFLFTATQHAREWGGTMTGMWIADRMVEAADTDPRISAVLDASEVFVFPVCNPDGYEFSWTTNRLWRKNRRLNSGGSYGVDLNRNWGYGWGGAGASSNQSSETYRGTAAFSEPETAGFRDWALPRTNIAAHLDIHAYSELLLWPWGYTSTLSPDQGSFNRVGLAAQAALKAVNGLTYTAGPINTTIYPASGGMNDWAYGSAGQLSYCTEVRDTGAYGFIMPASEIVPTAQENFAAALTIMEQSLDGCTITLVSGPGTTVVAGTVQSVSVTVTANVGTLLLSNAVRLRWQVDGGSVQSATMTGTGSARSGTLPAVDCDQSLAWWVEAETNFAVTRWPANVPGSVRTSDAPACAAPGDLDGSATVDAGDIAVLLLRFGTADAAADLDGSGTVDAGDIGMLLLLFG